MTTKGPALAHAVVAPERYSDLVARLTTVQKSSRGAPGYSRWVNRRLGRYIAAWAYRSGLTPNQVTAISSAFTFAAITVVALARPTWWLGLVLASALLIGYAFDSADGQLARLRGGGTPAGEWLDHVTDCVKGSAIHLAVAVCWFRFFRLPHPAYLLIPLSYSLVSAVFFFAVILSELLRRANAASRPRDTGRPESAPALRSILVLPADYGVLCLAFVTLGGHHLFGAVYTLLLAANLVFLMGALRNWFREMQSFTSH